MNNYRVRCECTDYINVTVQADDEAAAEEKAVAIASESDISLFATSGIFAVSCEKLPQKDDGGLTPLERYVKYDDEWRLRHNFGPLCAGGTIDEEFIFAVITLRHMPASWATDDCTDEDELLIGMVRNLIGAVIRKASGRQADCARLIGKYISEQIASDPVTVECFERFGEKLALQQ